MAKMSLFLATFFDLEPNFYSRLCRDFLMFLDDHKKMF